MHVYITGMNKFHISVLFHSLMFQAFILELFPEICLTNPVFSCLKIPELTVKPLQNCGRFNSAVMTSAGIFRSHEKGILNFSNIS